MPERRRITRTLLTMKPTFDPEEEYLIAYYRRLHATGKSDQGTGDLAVLAVTALFIGTGAFKDDMTWILVGFGIIAWRLVQGMLSSARYNRTLGSIIAKYEKACEAPSDDA